MDCIDLAQDRVQWKALLNTVMSRFYEMLNSRVATKLAAFQEGLSSMELIIF
jgi:hypothetical protein